MLTTLLNGYWRKNKAAHVAALDRTDFLMVLAREQANAFVADVDDRKRKLDRG